MEKVKYKCGFCGEEVTADQMDMNQQDIPAYCPHCGNVAWTDMKQYAVLVAEHKGIYEYQLNFDKDFDGNEDIYMEYWTYYSGEGFYFVRYDMRTGNEWRDGFIPCTNMPTPQFLLSEKNALYNYNVG